MVRERKTTRPKRVPARSARRTPARRAKDAGSIWDTPHIKAILSQPVGTTMDLTPEEADAILQEHLANPPSYDKAAADKAMRELRKIRRESGALLVRPHADD